MTRIEDVLEKYLPPETVAICSRWIQRKNIHLRITRGRATRYGDYMPLGTGKGHRITVNHDLNPYAFLITFVHEVAHLLCQEQHGPRHEPHGKAWQHEYRRLLNYFVQLDVFPEGLRTAVCRSLEQPGASGCSDPELMRALRKYDTGKAGHIVHLEELAEGTPFRLYQSGKRSVFLKGKKMRTRFHCMEIDSRREYFVSAIAEVEQVNPSAGTSD